MQIPTVKIIANNSSGFIVINESDFDASKDKAFSVDPKPSKKKEQAKRPKRKAAKASDPPLKKKISKGLDDALKFDEGTPGRFDNI